MLTTFYCLCARLHVRVLPPVPLSPHCNCDQTMAYHEEIVDDPGLFWAVDSFAIHNALALPGASIPQGMYMFTYSGQFCLHVNV